MIRVPTHREPTHPGEMLLEEFLIPMGITQRDLAAALHVPYHRINELANRRRGITPSTALRLARFFGTSADYWMNLQVRWDLYQANRREAQDLRRIKKVQAAEATPDLARRPRREYQQVLERVPRRKPLPGDELEP
jgi:addiction module HigA family antidote